MASIFLSFRSFVSKRNAIILRRHIKRVYYSTISKSNTKRLFLKPRHNNIITRSHLNGVSYLNRYHYPSSSCSLFYVSFNSFCTKSNSSTPTIINYFEILNLPQQFDVDENDLKVNFQNAMKEYH
eukprot:200454_1